MKEGIAGQERALSELTNTNATLKRHQVTVMDKFQRLQAQVRTYLGCQLLHTRRDMCV
jgi:hypothetical protein